MTTPEEPDRSSRQPLGVAARAVVRQGDERILLLQRSPAEVTDAGLWELPGGKMEFGESIVDVLVREVAEETGLTLTVGPVIHIGHYQARGFWISEVVFACGSEPAALVLSDEHTAYRWTLPEDITDLPLTEGARQVLDSLVQP